MRALELLGTDVARFRRASGDVAGALGAADRAVAAARRAYDKVWSKLPARTTGWISAASTKALTDSGWATSTRKACASPRSAAS